MITRNRIKFSEKQAALIWQQAIGTNLISTEDWQISVIYPGRINGDNGPDFRDAVILDRLRLTKGDVEVHVRSSDWYDHGHHTDPAYNNVILHVAMWHDSSLPTLLETRKRIPLLCLAKALRHQAYLLPPKLACSEIVERRDLQTIQNRLEVAGAERFRKKAADFRARLKQGHPGQVLFRGVMRALGYAKNTGPFAQLAERMPLSSLESKEGLAPKQALLLGTAGLLPSQRGQGKSALPGETLELERIWQLLGREVETMKENDWHLSHIYPNNSPARRIIALSYLLERYSELTLLPGIVQLMRDAPPPEGISVLEGGLIVAADGYWRDHFDFGIRSRTRISALLGNSKAREIAINVILPFAFSWGILANEAKLTNNAAKLYHNYPRLAEDCLTRHMARQLGLDDSFDFTAGRQQGLIHIFKTYCCRGGCEQCPLVG